MRNLLIGSSLFFLSLTANADNEAFNHSFVGKCLNYSLATNHVEEYSYVLYLVSTKDSEFLKMELAHYFTLSQESDSQVVISYKLNSSEEDFLNGADLVDTLLEQRKIMGSCLYV